MIVRIYPTQDTYITNESDLLTNNFGIDEILELSKKSKTPLYQGEIYSKILMQFDLSNISTQISGGYIQNPKFCLNLKTVDAKELPINYNINTFPISQSWTMGTGRSAVNVTNGASWEYLDGIKPWISSSLNTGSSGGATYYAGSVYNQIVGIPTSSFLYSFCEYSSSLNLSQSFVYQNSDINMDVTDIIRSWVCGTIPNNGFLLTFPTQSDGIDYGSINFYSKESNTIYSPYLEIKWDDSSYNTGSLNSGSLQRVVYIRNLNKEYKQNSIPRMNVFSRDMYPQNTFNKFFFRYLDCAYLPETSYYSIVDALSTETIVSFDENYTKISCDGTDNFFYLNLNGFPQERYYRVIFKVIDNDGSVNYYQDPNYFKITR